MKMKRKYTIQAFQSMYAVELCRVSGIYFCQLQVYNSSYLFDPLNVHPGIYVFTANVSCHTSMYRVVTLIN